MPKHNAHVQQLNRAIAKRLRNEMENAPLLESEHALRDAKRSSSRGVTNGWLRERMARDPEVASALPSEKSFNRLISGASMIPAWFIVAACRALGVPVERVIVAPILDERRYTQHALYQDAVDNLLRRRLPDVETWERLLQHGIELGNSFRLIAHSDPARAAQYADQLEELARRLSRSKAKGSRGSVLHRDPTDGTRVWSETPPPE